MCSPDGGAVSGLGLGREDFDAVTKEKRGRAGATAADDGGELDLDETQAKYEYQMVLEAQQSTGTSSCLKLVSMDLMPDPQLMWSCPKSN
jgi:hypothetical protein